MEDVRNCHNGGSFSKYRPFKGRKSKAILLLVLSGGSFGTLGILFSPIGAVSCLAHFPDSGQPRLSRMALIDSLAHEYPNPTFANELNSSARENGSLLDYYSPESSTVGLLLHLPEEGYHLVVFRAHGTQNLPVLVTNSPYSPDEMQGDQLLGRLGPVDINGQKYFGATPGFVRNDMCGHFQGSIIVAMGCLTADPELASAFLSKGAAYFIGWAGMVTLSHADSFTSQLVASLLRGTPVSDAVGSLNSHGGVDLETGARLEYFGP